MLPDHAIHDDPTIRRVTRSPYPHHIFYEPTGDEIIIHSVRHAARNQSGAPGSSNQEVVLFFGFANYSSNGAHAIATNWN